jgi:uncharacterized membrane protein
MKLTISDLFKFDRFFTPVLIKVLYVVYIIGGGIWTVYGIINYFVYSAEIKSAFAEYGEGFDASFANQIVSFGVAGSIIGYLLGMLLLRLLFEAMIVVFNIYGNLKSMRETLASENTPVSYPQFPQ